jgi:hypothetical protein
MVPLCVSTWLSTKLSCPRGGAAASPAASASTESDWRDCAARMAARRFSGTAKLTKMGSMRLMTTSGLPSTALTTLPSCTSTLPVRPPMGARTSVYSRLSRAFSTAAVSASTDARWGLRIAERLVALVLGDDALLEQLLRAPQVVVRLPGLRLVAREVGLRLGERGAVGTRVDLEQQVARAHGLALRKGTRTIWPAACAFTETVSRGSTWPCAGRGGRHRTATGALGAR